MGLLLLFPSPAGGGSTYEDATSLARSDGVSQVGNIDFYVTIALGGIHEDEVGLNRVMSLSGAADVTLAEAVSLSRAAGITIDTLMTMYDMLSLARALGIVTSLGATTYEDAVGLNRVMSLSGAAALTLAEAVSLTRAAGITIDTLMTMYDTLSLAKVLAIVTSLGTATYEDAIALGRSLSISELEETEAAIAAIIRAWTLNERGSAWTLNERETAWTLKDDYR